MSTFVLSSINAGWFPVGGTNIIVGLAFFYGGIAQLLTGMLEFRVGNTFGVTAFTSYGAFWLALAFIFIPGSGISDAITKAAFHPAPGLFLLGWTIFTAMLFLCTFRLNNALVVTLGLLLVALILLTIGELGPGTGAHVLGGYVGVATAIAAWYTALSMLLSGVNFPFTLPAHGLRNEVAPWHESAPQRRSFTPPRPTLVHSLCLLKVGLPRDALIEKDDPN